MGSLCQFKRYENDNDILREEKQETPYDINKEMNIQNNKFFDVIEKCKLEEKAEYEKIENQIDYIYDEKGELRNKKTNEKVGKLDQKEYEKVGEYVTKYIQYLILKKYNFIPMYVPSNETSNFYTRIKDIPQCEILTSKNFSNFEKCICIIQGTGAVRPGLWARSVCINNNINLGSIIPYIEKFEKDFSFVVFNPNENFDIDDKNKIIKEFNIMGQHCLYVYINIIKKNVNIKNVFFISHSMGGNYTIEILKENEEDLLSGKIKKIAFTESAHKNLYSKLSEKAQLVLKQIARDYVSSDKPVGEFLYSSEKSGNGVDCYSSGHNQHEFTSGYAIGAIFQFFYEEN